MSDVHRLRLWPREVQPRVGWDVRIKISTIDDGTVLGFVSAGLWGGR